MAKWFYGSRFTNAVAQGVTRFFTLAGEQSPVTIATGTEANQQTLCRSSYTASNLWCNVTAITGTLTITDRKNGGAGGQSISVTTTGTKEDTTHTTSLADGDLYCMQGVMSNSHSDACTLQTMSVILDDGGTIAPMILAGGLNAGGLAANNFAFVAGTPSSAATETDSRITIRFNATFSRMRTFLTSTSSGEFDYYFNGVAGTQALSYTGESGAKEDTTATDIVTPGETWNVKWISTGGTTLSTFQTKSNATANLLVASRTSIAGIGASTTNYYAIGGTLQVPATTESSAQIKARVADTWKNFQANITANSRSDATRIDFRAGAASPSGGPALSVSGGTTGIVEDLSGSYTSATTDLINFRLVVGGGTGTISVTAIGVQQGVVISAAAIPNKIYMVSQAVNRSSMY